MIAALLLFSAITLALGIAVAVWRARSERRHGLFPGTEPGEGDHIIDNGYISGGPGGGHPTITRVTRDPQRYARAFVPRRKEKDKKP